jgi:malate dehydrogenase (oxaloacetate-decarboxylating)
MNDKPIVFAMANPIPEIYPEEALAAGAAVVGTGRSDYPNQVNNLLAFPGIFRGALDAKAKDITIEMKVAAPHAIAEVVSEKELIAIFIIPNTLDGRVTVSVAKAVATTAIQGTKEKSSVS